MKSTHVRVSSHKVLSRTASGGESLAMIGHCCSTIHAALDPSS
jgi:hypothetical protein